MKSNGEGQGTLPIVMCQGMRKHLKCKFPSSHLNSLRPHGWLLVPHTALKEEKYRILSLFAVKTVFR